MSWICTSVNRKFLDHFETEELARDSWRLSFSSSSPDEPVFQNGRVYFEGQLIGHCYCLPAKTSPTEF